jgi:Holliday junction resolvasome RuvABC endonuclease subunit
VRSFPDDSRAFVESFFELGSWLALRLRSRSLGAWNLAVEEAVVRRNPAVSIKIARAAGELSGPLSANAVGSTSWIRASVWRKRVLGISPFTGRGAAKLAAREYVPPLVEGFEEVASILGASEDLADAAGIALWLSLTEEEP